jgi:predicted peptidase
MRSMIFPLMLSGILAVMTTGTQAQAKEGSGLMDRVVTVDGKKHEYQVFVPKQLVGKRDVPIIVFLHGIGQRGTGGFLPKSGAGAVVAQHYLEQLPAIAVLPQCAKGKYWHDREMERMVMAALDHSAREFSADQKRLYLAGVSMGGYGAWHLAGAYPGKFAAVVPICGGSTIMSGDRFTPLAKKIGRTPVWAFHGTNDNVVPVSESRNMVEALKKVEGSRVRYSEYSGVGHNVWLNAASEPELLKWLLQQRAE